MFSSFLITFRESFEASLILGIMLAYLQKTNKPHYRNFVYIGVLMGVASSALVAFGFSLAVGKFEGTAEQLFEGTMMLIAALFVTTMIVWMASQKDISLQIQEKVRENVERNYGFGLAMLSFVAVLREGIEVVVFLNAVAFVEGGMIFGAISGIGLAMLAGYLFFKAILRFDLSKFFTVTGGLLILMAAGLVMSGIHEYQEAKLVTIFTEPAWSTASILGANTETGKFLHSFIGYNDRPSVLGVLGYFGYLAVALLVWKDALHNTK